MASDLLEKPALSPKELQDIKNKRAGLAIFQVSWIMVFVALIFVNAQLRTQTATWPPPGVNQLEPIVPTAMTLALIISSLLARRAVRAVKSDDQAGFRANWRITIALGALFVVVMALEWISVPYSGQFSNVFRLMVGFHGVHALVIGGFLVNVYRSAGAYGSANFWPVEAAASLWYFVAVAWLLFYAVLYIL
jgi:heme/copper-type cytochrome/quinol oxidase subunit 3